MGVLTSPFVTGLDKFIKFRKFTLQLEQLRADELSITDIMLL